MARITTTATAALLRRYVNEVKAHAAGTVAELRARGADDLLIIAGCNDVADDAAKAGDPTKARHCRDLANATIHHIHNHPTEGTPL